MGPRTPPPREGDGVPSAARQQARALGIRAEAFVAERVLARGGEVLARNWAAAGGELDLVVRFGERVRFVEVKARTEALPDPSELVTAEKRRKLRAVANAWLDAFGAEVDEAAFAVAVVDPTTTPWSLTWIDDAFDG